MDSSFFHIPKRKIISTPLKSIILTSLIFTSYIVYVDYIDITIDNIF